MKTVLITGCSAGGIGNALAREFHSQALRVFATARKTSDVEDLAALGIEILALDVEFPEMISEAKRIIEEKTGGTLDILVNNAGRSYVAPSLELDLDEVQKTFETNLFSIMRMVQTFSGLLIKSKGTIVNIGTYFPDMPFPFRGTYAATKGALQAYSNVLRVELAPFDVKVLLVRTGPVVSRIARTKRSLLPNSLYYPINDEFERQIAISQNGAMDTSVYAAKVVSHILARGSKREFSLGGKKWLLWILTTLAPKSIFDLVMTKMFSLDTLRRIHQKQIA